MSKQPWKRAYQLSRARQVGAPPPPGAPSPLRPRRFPWASLTILLLLALGAGSWYAWTNRGVLIPKYDKQLPPPVRKLADKTPLPAAEFMTSEFDSGLGIGLVIGGDYQRLLSDTTPWKINWVVTVLGGGHLRLSAPGLKVNVDDNKISTYTLTIKDVYADKPWEPWLPELRRAGATPEVNWRTATRATDMPRGEGIFPKVGHGGKDFGGVAAHSAYTLYFQDGWLSRIEGGLSTGEYRLLPLHIQRQEQGQQQPQAPPQIDPPAPPGLAPTAPK